MRLTTHRLTRIALMAALCVALRYAFGAFPNVKPITAIFLVLTISWGLLDAWLVMALTMTVTALVLGFGPWVAWQLAAYTVVLGLWKFLAYPLTSLSQSAIIKQISQASLAGFMGIIYGLVIDSLSAILYSMPIWAYVLNGLGFNLAHALSTAIFYPIITTIFARLGPDTERKKP